MECGAQNLLIHSINARNLDRITINKTHVTHITVKKFLKAVSNGLRISVQYVHCGAWTIIDFFIQHDHSCT